MTQDERDTHDHDIGDGNGALEPLASRVFAWCVTGAIGALIVGGIVALLTIF